MNFLTDVGLVATAAAVTTAAAPTASTAAATSPATAALFTWTSFVDGQRAAVDLFEIQTLDGRPSLIGIDELDEAKALAAARVAVHDHLGTLHLAKGSKQLF